MGRKPKAMYLSERSEEAPNLILCSLEGDVSAEDLKCHFHSPRLRPPVYQHPLGPRALEQLETGPRWPWFQSPVEGALAPPRCGEPAGPPERGQIHRCHRARHSRPGAVR